jgi:hypothetical protein
MVMAPRLDAAVAGEVGVGLRVHARMMSASFRALRSSSADVSRGARLLAATAS